MPFKSRAQRCYLFARHPAMARRWARHTPKGTRLPARKRSRRRRGSRRKKRG